ncbi:hypothetical protein GBAR_LOCUS18324 [Geodia barretti]|uniref:Uncharacterized protein n=1 Tax=Geodia barretti TaxID=519541 RepID=A0AA35SLQ9_GEOBA|nr:hypothetical protein GBAR_LOCUS18324 [Geodia barretti]
MKLHVSNEQCLAKDIALASLSPFESCHYNNHNVNSMLLLTNVMITNSLLRYVSSTSRAALSSLLTPNSILQ